METSASATAPVLAREHVTGHSINPYSWRVCNLADALQGAGQEPPWVVKDLLLAESATQVSAHPHSMKSLAWLSASLEAVAKHTVWGRFDASRVNRSLFLETEDSRWVVEQRIRGLAAGLGLKGIEDAPGFHYLRTGPFNLVDMEQSLAQILSEYRPDFVVLSTLQNLLSGRNWKNQDEMDAVNALIVRLSSDFCPIVEITHSPWDSRQKRAIGTISQAANFATALHFEKRQTDKGTLLHAIVDSKLGNDVPDFTLKLVTENGEVRGFTYEGSGWPKGARKDAVLQALTENPECPAKDIAERCGVSTRYVERLRKEQEGS